jgi:RimJ/RimL family protein N-acetyltransferase
VRLPRLSGEQVTLVPVSHSVAVAILAGDASTVLSGLGLAAGTGWPHEETPDAVRALAEHGRPGDESEWLITVGGEVVGECGWRGGPNPDGDAEIGYGIATPHRGRGLGHEAVGLLTTWADRQTGVRRLVARVLPGNEPSRRVLHRLGFTPDGDEPPYLRYARTTPTDDGGRGP